MATVGIGQEYEDFFLELLVLVKERGIEISDYAEGLLALSTEAWFEEFPGLANEARTREFARDLLLASLEDQHVAEKTTKQLQVGYGDLMYALAVTAQPKLRDFLDKGF